MALVMRSSEMVNTQIFREDVAASMLFRMAVRQASPGLKYTSFLTAGALFRKEKRVFNGGKVKVGL